MTRTSMTVARRKQNSRQQQLGMGDMINPFPYQQMCAITGMSPFLHQQLSMGAGMTPFPYQQMCVSNGIAPFMPHQQVGIGKGMCAPSPGHSLDMSNMPPRFTRSVVKSKSFPQEPPPLPGSDEAPDYVRGAVQRISPVLAKQWLGELLYVRVKKEISKHVGKITGMLLEMDNDALFSLIGDRQQLRKNIAQAWKVLCGNGSNKLMEKMSNWVA